MPMGASITAHMNRGLHRNSYEDSGAYGYDFTGAHGLSQRFGILTDISSFMRDNECMGEKLIILMHNFHQILAVIPQGRRADSWLHRLLLVKSGANPNLFI